MQKEIEDLVLRYLPLTDKKAKDFCVRHGISKANEEQVVSDARLSLINLAHRYDGRGSFGGYLSIMLDHKIIDIHRSRNKRTPRVFFEEELPEIPVESDVFLRIELRRLLSKALNELDVRSRFILNSFFGITVPKHTLKEIGEILGVTESAVCLAKKSALHKLKSQIF